MALVSGLALIGRNTEQNYADLLRHSVTVGYPRCDEASLLERPKSTPFAGPLPAQLMANVSLLIDHLSLVNDRIDISAKIINKSSISLPAYSTTGMPIRLSPRITESNATPAVLQNLAGWNSRQPIGFDVPPGTTHSIVFSVAKPTRPGTYRIAVSMVQDGVAWFTTGECTSPSARRRSTWPLTIRCVSRTKGTSAHPPSEPPLYAATTMPGTMHP